MLSHILQSLWGFALYLVPASLSGAALEILIPGEAQSLASRLRAVPIWSLYIALGVTLSAALSYLWSQLHLTPIFSLDLRGSVRAKDWPTLILAFTVFPAASLFIYDFFYYWFHRAQHRYKTMWRVHRVHHSIKELNAFNDYHHWLEDALRVPTILVPMSLLINVQVPEVVVYTMLLRFSGQVTHANSRVSYGWLRYVFAEPRYHRIHHSTEAKHFGKNFAFLFPVWDVVFGTAYFPRKNEYPKTGLAALPEPKGIRDYALSPFTRG